MGLNSAAHVTAADKRLTLVATFSRLATSFHYGLLTWSTLIKHNAVSVLVAWIRDGRALVRTGNNRTLRADVVTVSVCPALHRPSPCRMRTSWHIYVVYPYRSQLSGFEGLGASTIEA
jgi:hypothetical protein